MRVAHDETNFGIGTLATATDIRWWWPFDEFAPPGAAPYLAIDRLQPRYANNSIGSLKPRTGYSPTRSRSKSLSTKSANARESSTVLPNCLVRVSRRDAMLTAGPITVKSSLVRDPILPYMTSPTWTPMP